MDIKTYKMKVKKLKIEHSELGLMEVNTEIPKEVKEIVGDVASDYSKYPCFYHADITKTQDGNFEIKNLMVIKPDGVNVGWMENSKGNKNFITVIKNMKVGDDITVYPKGVISVIYN